MVLLFLGSMRATAAVFLSIPLSGAGRVSGHQRRRRTVNTMVLGGLALVFLAIDRQFRDRSGEHFPGTSKWGNCRRWAAEKGGNEVALAVLAATLATAIVFFPVVFLYGVSRFLFIALASSVVFALFASYMVAMTVVRCTARSSCTSMKQMKNSKATPDPYSGG